VPLPFEYSYGCIVFVICNHLTLHTAYFHFLSSLRSTLLSVVTKNILGCADAGFGSEKSWPPAYSPTTCLYYKRKALHVKAKG
jgi:hypothetical protein